VTDFPDGKAGFKCNRASLEIVIEMCELIRKHDPSNIGAIAMLELCCDELLKNPEKDEFFVDLSSIVP